MWRQDTRNDVVDTFVWFILGVYVLSEQVDAGAAAARRLGPSPFADPHQLMGLRQCHSGRQVVGKAAPTVTTVPLSCIPQSFKRWAHE